MNTEIQQDIGISSNIRSERRLKFDHNNKRHVKSTSLSQKEEAIELLACCMHVMGVLANEVARKWYLARRNVTKQS